MQGKLGQQAVSGIAGACSGILLAALTNQSGGPQGIFSDLVAPATIGGALGVAIASYPRTAAAVGVLALAAAFPSQSQSQVMDAQLKSFARSVARSSYNGASQANRYALNTTYIGYHLSRILSAGSATVDKDFAEKEVAKSEANPFSGVRELR